MIPSLETKQIHNPEKHIKEQSAVASEQTMIFITVLVQREWRDSAPYELQLAGCDQHEIRANIPKTSPCSPHTFFQWPLAWFPKATKHELIHKRTTRSKTIVGEQV